MSGTHEHVHEEPAAEPAAEPEAAAAAPEHEHPPIPPDDVSQAVSIALDAATSADVTVTCTHEEGSDTWTWAAFVPAPTEEDPAAQQGVSRQYVLPAEQSEPDPTVLDGMVTEITSTVTAIQGASA